MKNIKKRPIDDKIENLTRSVQKKYSLISSREIQLWKVYLSVAFVGGFVAAIILIIRTSYK